MNKLKRNKSKRNKSKRNKSKRNKSKRNKSKRNKSKRNKFDGSKQYLEEKDKIRSYFQTIKHKPTAVIYLIDCIQKNEFDKDEIIELLTYFKTEIKLSAFDKFADEKINIIKNSQPNWMIEGEKKDKFDLDLWNNINNKNKEGMNYLTDFSIKHPDNFYITQCLYYFTVRLNRIFDDFSIGDDHYNDILMLIKKIMDSGRINDDARSKTVNQFATYINRIHKILESKEVSNEDRIRFNALVGIFTVMFFENMSVLDQNVAKPSKL
jgi:hypothetical protein